MEVDSSHGAKNWSKPENGGYIWHTTSSGKTLTSFIDLRVGNELGRTTGAREITSRRAITELICCAKIIRAARLATELDFIDKVFFVVDRKDLDYQTMKEYPSRDDLDFDGGLYAKLERLAKFFSRVHRETLRKNEFFEALNPRAQSCDSNRNPNKQK